MPSAFRSLALRVIGFLAAILFAYYYTLLDVANGTFLTTFHTEFPQEVMLAVMTALHGYAAWRFARGRAFNFVLGGVALASFIREHNNQLAELWFHNAWAVGSVPVLAVTLWYLATHWRSFVADLTAVSETYGFGVLTAGYLFLHVFSRLFGANPLWRARMGEAFDRDVARMAEEGLELAGYSIMLVGTLEVFAWWRRARVG